MMKSSQNAAYRVVFVRHGQSTWNLSNRFTGWQDVDLTEQGVNEAVLAGQMLKEQGFKFDIVFTSVLKRAIKTWNVIASETDRLWIPHVKTWRLNERNYGELEGLNKAETAAKHGEDKVLIWRRSYDVPPPQLSRDDERHPCKDEKYSTLPQDCLPGAESLKTTLDRVLPYWHDHICPQILDNKSVVVVAHGNSLRAIVKQLTGMNENEILGYNIPTAVPLIMEFDEKLNLVNNFFLMDEAELKERMEAVANQGKAK